MTESQFKKMVQAACIGAVTVFFIMVLVLIVLFSQRAAKQRNLDNLERQIDKAYELEQKLEYDIDYYQTVEYIELYARESLGMLKSGEQKFRPN